jgi:hypothetical protein
MNQKLFAYSIQMVGFIAIQWSKLDKMVQFLNVRLFCPDFKKLKQDGGQKCSDSGWPVPAEIDNSKTRLILFSDVNCILFSRGRC